MFIPSNSVDESIRNRSAASASESKGPRQDDQVAVAAVPWVLSDCGRPSERLGESRCLVLAAMGLCRCGRPNDFEHNASPPQCNIVSEEDGTRAKSLVFTSVERMV